VISTPVSKDQTASEKRDGLANSKQDGTSFLVVDVDTRGIDNVLQESSIPDEDLKKSSIGNKGNTDKVNEYIKLFNNEKARLIKDLKDKEKSVLETLKGLDKSALCKEILQKVLAQNENLKSVSPAADLSNFVEAKKSQIGLLLTRQESLVALVTNTSSIARKELEKSSIKSISDMEKASSYGDYLNQITQMCLAAKSILETFRNQMEGQKTAIQTHSYGWDKVLGELVATNTFLSKSAIPELNRRKVWETKVESYKENYSKLLQAEGSTRETFNSCFTERNSLDKLPQCFLNLLQNTKPREKVSQAPSWDSVKSRTLKTPEEMKTHYSVSSKTARPSVIKSRLLELKDLLAKVQGQLETTKAERQKIKEQRENIIQEISNNVTATEEFGKQIDLEKAEVEQLNEEIRRFTTSIQNLEVLLVDTQNEKKSLEEKVKNESEKFPIVKKDISSKVNNVRTDLEYNIDALESKKSQLNDLIEECLKLDEIVPHHDALLKENKEMENECHQLDAEINRLKDVIDRLKKKVSTKDAQRKQGMK